MLKKQLRNQRGFTMIEIIAVLVILGILAAVAVPKYLDMADQARSKAAQAAIGEVKGRLASVQAKMMMTSGVAPDAANILATSATANYYGSAENLYNVGPDFTLTAPTAGALGSISISVSKVQGVDLIVASNGVFTAASGR